ncbi:MAG: hypothetical protein HKN74_12020 [Acidimicrobiia bacterium]|nr:hypothetical protein [Acidimicrobiia bacterium]MBT8215844.1 hypothetical protein [Acidimicrobiia bacterium]NNF11005.1 hypothetical protein [Acidimicrobiia bacterium]NNL68849.1 hypothetical protein [Acidimicrobiia bacterium]
MIKAAYLRVYVPGDGSQEPAETPGSDLREVADYGLMSESLNDGVLTATWNDSVYVCPRHPRLRLLEGLLGFRNAYPGLTAELLIPEEVAERAADELEALRHRNPDAKSHILASPWHVPLRWFSAFDPEERSVVEADGTSSVRYRTTIGQADERLTRSLVILQAAGFQDAVIDQVQELHNWINGFDEDDLLELDYGGVADLFSDGALALDETAADIQASLSALEAGNLDEASEHYARAAARWAHAQSLTYMN